MKRTTLLVAAISGAFLAAPAARADWDLGDPCKMHFPQMPDPAGWDVSFYSAQMISNPFGGGDPYLASAWPSGDDWQCSGTGPVTDIHFWVSMQGDTLQSNPGGVVPFQIMWLGVRIRDNVPAGEDNGGRTYEFSTPGITLWSAEFDDPSSQYSVRHWAANAQGWYVPVSDEAFPQDHDHIYQVNIPDAGNNADGEFPFGQIEGEIYWLEIDLAAKRLDENGLPTEEPVDLGWKTALRDCKFMDDATYYYQTSNPAPGFQNIQEHRRVIIEGEARDFAFVITPEPATLALVALGAAGLVLGRGRGRRAQPRRSTSAVMPCSKPSPR
jgi:hypothetical protein